MAASSVVLVGVFYIIVGLVDMVDPSSPARQCCLLMWDQLPVWTTDREQLESEERGCQVQALSGSKPSLSCGGRGWKRWATGATWGIWLLWRQVWPPRNQEASRVMGGGEVDVTWLGVGVSSNRKVELPDWGVGAELTSRDPHARVSRVAELKSSHFGGEAEGKRCGKWKGGKSLWVTGVDDFSSPLNRALRCTIEMSCENSRDDRQISSSEVMSLQLTHSRFVSCVTLASAEGVVALGGLPSAAAWRGCVVTRKGGRQKDRKTEGKGPNANVGPTQQQHQQRHWNKGGLEHLSPSKSPRYWKKAREMAPSMLHWGKIAIGWSLLQAVSISAMEFFILANINSYLKEAFAENGSGPFILVYFCLFVAAQIFQAVMTVDAAMHRNSMQVVATVIFNFMCVIYAVAQVEEINHVRDCSLNYLSEWATNNTNTTSTCPEPFVGNFSVAVGIIEDSLDYVYRVKSTEYAVIGVASVSALVGAALGWKLYQEYGWKIFEEVGASVRKKYVVRRYHLFILFLKLNIYFTMGIVAQMVCAYYYTQKGTGDQTLAGTNTSFFHPSQFKGVLLPVGIIFIGLREAYFTIEHLPGP
ncbi:hypothetical protein BDK51DRAFT_25616 [Blyttiomyces helicus]|uniref:Uncharacterized protein n=1 Tax=Blyttiomyces helicus TaxID=388810 RepID=A0A4P9WP86_9FUNG|nr:hypothetical protein BDK51DRAFT_25616 [Blyttiomyces helicus]|eukprot:RKO94834.1 hypothetical protein BDK51DRAFT_25616 [Blyttiomyces helicus]